MNRQRVTTGLVVCAAVVLAGCQGDGDPRELPHPQFDPYQVFAQPAQAGDGDDDGDPADFDERIEQAMDGDEGADSPPARSRRTVPLGASLIAEVPDEPEVWRWSRRSDLTLVSYTPRGEEPQMVMLTKEFDRLGGVSRTRRMRAFLADVDSGMDVGFDVRRLAEAAEHDGLDLEAMMEGEQPEIDEIVEALTGVDTVTGGRGIGYQSHPDSFSGWRWYGVNRRDVIVRLATTQGRWASQPAGSTMVDAGQLQQLVSEIDVEHDGEAIDLDVGAMDGGDIRRQGGRPARMYVGTLETEPDRGVYVAVLCASGCPVAADLAELVDGLRADEAPSGGGQTDFDDHAGALGLELE